MIIQNKIQNCGWDKRNMNEVTNLVVHHSAFRQTDVNNQTRFEQLRSFHTNQGWNGLSYHFVIFKNGETWQTNNFDDLTWTDGINYNSIGILVDGYFHDNYDKPNIEQLKSLDYLLGDLCNNHPEFPAVRKDVKAHRDVNLTACCGDDLYPYVVEWRETGKLKVLDATQEVKPPISTSTSQSEVFTTKSTKQELIDFINSKEAFDPATKADFIREANQGGVLFYLMNNASIREELQKQINEKINLQREVTLLGRDKTSNLQIVNDLNVQITDLQNNIKILKEKQVIQSNVNLELNDTINIIKRGYLKVSKIWESKSVQAFVVIATGAITAYQTTNDIFATGGIILAGLSALLFSTIKDLAKINQTQKILDK